MDSLNDPFKDFLQNLPSENDIESALLLGLCQLASVPDEVIFIIRSLLKNGCPANVVVKTFIEVGEKLKEKGAKNNGTGN